MSRLLKLFGVVVMIVVLGFILSWISAIYRQTKSTKNGNDFCSYTETTVYGLPLSYKETSVNSDNPSFLNICQEDNIKGPNIEVNRLLIDIIFWSLIVTIMVFGIRRIRDYKA